jgi:hypothetical protein
MLWNRPFGQGCLGYHLLIADYVASVMSSNSNIHFNLGRVAHHVNGSPRAENRALANNGKG